MVADDAHGALEFRVVQPFSVSMEQIELLVIDSPSSADAVVIEFACFVGCVQALQDEPETLWLFLWFVVLEPFSLDQPALKRHGCPTTDSWSGLTNTKRCNDHRARSMQDSKQFKRAQK